MSLDLDQRQRAMLREMQVRVWWPAAARPAETPVAPLRQSVLAHNTAPVPHPVETAPASDLPETPGTPGKAVVQPAPIGAPSALDAMDMPALAQAVAVCSACQLCDGRKTAVFALALPARQTDWMVVGDPPTDDEERAGHPFAAAEGELLDNMLRAVQCSRSGIGAAGAWLTHAVKCRPALVRNPQPEELARCAMYLRREVALVRPRVILAMGRFAALALLLPSDPAIAQVPAGKLRGRLHAFEGVPVVVTYSPARLLRAPQEKAGAWADLCLARAAAQDSLHTAAP